jgi:hypothetical protein
MLEGRTLIVIDPIAFYAKSGLWAFTQIAECATNDKAMVLVVPPFATCLARLRLHQLLQDAANRFFSSYYRPPIPPGKFAGLGLGITDQEDMLRYLRLTVAPQVSNPASMAPVNPAIALA